jgi:hypothetical protein
MKTLLLYQIDKVKGEQIRWVCLPLHISCVVVPPLVPPLAEEMMVFGGFTQSEVFELLDALRRQGIQPPRLKAMLTPHNAGWDPHRLQRELLEEEKRMNK